MTLQWNRNAHNMTIIINVSLISHKTAVTQLNSNRAHRIPR